MSKPFDDKDEDFESLNIDGDFENVWEDGDGTAGNHAVHVGVTDPAETLQACDGGFVEED